MVCEGNSHARAASLVGGREHDEQHRNGVEISLKCFMFTSPFKD